MTKASLSLLACFMVYGVTVGGCSSSSTPNDGTGASSSSGGTTKTGSSGGGGGLNSGGSGSGGTNSSGSSSGTGDDTTPLGDDAADAGDDSGDASDDAGDDADATSSEASTGDDAAAAQDGAQPCGPTNCIGCCDSNGVCQGGGTTTACGNNGQTCSNCGAGTCGPGVCIGGGLDAGTPSQCAGVTCFAPDDCVYLQALISVGGGPNCNFTMCSYATGRGICQ
ncbi:MAG TPA: hypothetical protein VHV30_14285 [Polyangiaceae bacterium]|jgi:hypothetical protein|nr:hypothetical protein [Polyangiaceae bacterium]